MPNSACRRFISSSTWAWMVTSRAVVGSSAISSTGLHERAIAIMTRWRMPPLNSWGYPSSAVSGFAMPTSPSMAVAISRAARRSRVRCRRIASMSWLPMV